MSNLSSVLAELRQERKRLDAAISALEGVSSNGSTPRGVKRMSPAARKRIGAAQRARWAKWRKRQRKTAA